MGVKTESRLSWTELKRTGLKTELYVVFLGKTDGRRRSTSVGAFSLHNFDQMYRIEHPKIDLKIRQVKISEIKVAIQFYLAIY